MVAEWKRAERKRELGGGPVVTIPRGRECSGTSRQIFTCFSTAELAAVVRIELHEWFPGGDRPDID